MIHDGVELPKLLPIARASALLGIEESALRQWIADRSVSAMRINGVVHVVTESIADRLGEQTPSRRNRDGE